MFYLAIVIAVSQVRNVQFRKEMLHSVAQTELLKMACSAHNFFPAQFRHFPKAIDWHFTWLAVTQVRKAQFLKEMLHSVGSLMVFRFVRVCHLCSSILPPPHAHTHTRALTHTHTHIHTALSTGDGRIQLSSPESYPLALETVTTEITRLQTSMQSMLQQLNTLALAVSGLTRMRGQVRVWRCGSVRV